MKLKFGSFEFEADISDLIEFFMFGLVPLLGIVGLFVLLILGSI